MSPSSAQPPEGSLNAQPASEEDDADWDNETLTLNTLAHVGEKLGARRFFRDFLGALIDNTTVDIPKEIRLLRDRVN